MGSWSKTVPVTGTKIVDIPSIHSNNWDAFDDWISDEHYGFTHALSGQHLEGRTSVVTAAGSADILGTSSPFTGAIGWDTDRGTGLLYDGTNWTIWSQLPMSRVQAYRNADYSIPATATGSASYPIPFDIEQKDSISEYNTSTFAFAASADGYYWINSRLSIQSATGGVNTMSFISIQSSAGVERTKQGTFAVFTLSTDEMPLMSNTVAFLSRGERVQVTVAHDQATSLTLKGIDADSKPRSVLKIHRLS